MMSCAFGAGQTAALFVAPDLRFGPWPMVLPLVLAGVVLMWLAFVAVPRVERTDSRAIRPCTRSA